jgi:hypothetical protein
MQTKMWSKVGFMGIKLDMSKAYDRMKWKFLEAVMRKLGFEDRWINLVMSCVQSMSYSVVINGNPVGHIRPTRGIKQGDPISPYLFLLRAKALSALLSKAVHSGTITGIPTSPKGFRISHLFFVDGSLLFCRTNSVEWRRSIIILWIYEAGSGQKLNLDKTSVFFSRNTSQEKRQEILSLSGLSEAHHFDTYLRLPSLIGKSKIQAFNNTKERVWNELTNGKVKFLSQVEKEILIKAVVQAIRTYCMNVFLLPVTLCKDLNSMM